MSLTIPTADELYAAAQAEIQARNASLTDFSPGSALDAITGAGVVLADQSIRIGLDAMQARMIATATGADLDAAVTDRYPTLTRRAASAAVGSVTISRGGATGAVSVPLGTQIRGTVTGQTVTVTTTEAATMAADADDVSVAAECTSTGPTGNVAAGVLTAFVTPLADDTTATVTNSARFAGGADAESDSAYRARAQAYPLTLRRATKSALATGALTVPGVAYVTVDESMLDTDQRVYVYVGDPDGRANDTLADLVAVELEDWRAAGVLVTVLAAEREEVDLTVVVYVAPGTATAALTAACRAAVLAYTDSLSPNQRLYLSAAQAAALGASADVRGAVATSTATTGAYVEVTDPQNALRVTAGDLTLTLVEIPT